VKNTYLTDQDKNETLTNHLTTSAIYTIQDYPLLKSSDDFTKEKVKLHVVFEKCIKMTYCFYRAYICGNDCAVEAK